MKKVFALLLAMLMIISVMTGCGNKGENAPEGKGAGEEGSKEENSQDENSQDEKAFLESLKTFADIQALEGVEFGNMSSLEEKLLIVAFTLPDGTIYRAVADITPEQDEAIWGVDFFAEDHDEQVAAILAPLEIKQIDNLSQFILTEEQMDQLVGKTGAELMEDGWRVNGFYLDEKEFYVIKEFFEYTIIVKEAPAYDPDADVEQEDLFKDAVVASVSFSRLDEPAYDIERELYGE